MEVTEAPAITIVMTAGANLRRVPATAMMMHGRSDAVLAMVNFAHPLRLAGEVGEGSSATGSEGNGVEEADHRSRMLPAEQPALLSRD